MLGVKYQSKDSLMKRLKKLVKACEEIALTGPMQERLLTCLNALDGDPEGIPIGKINGIPISSVGFKPYSFDPNKKNYIDKLLKGCKKYSNDKKLTQENPDSFMKKLTICCHYVNADLRDNRALTSEDYRFELTMDATISSLFRKCKARKYDKRMEEHNEMQRESDHWKNFDPIQLLYKNK
ncbi:3062_t:CDS:2 [Dentiscutata erythropus]|uniref:3062_t:CDS:1 n=1 Tax=Dentiscutata erythropus TaxID=1348616 RepID=A0A9N9K3E3_9GLOM|nr:3062_t:CDS:2 [Dentiscutata erythropus]